MEDYFAQLGDGNVKSIFLRQYVVMDLYVTAVSVLEKSGYKSRDLVERCGDAKEMVAYLTTVEQTREYIKKLFRRCWICAVRRWTENTTASCRRQRPTSTIIFEKDGISPEYGRSGGKSESEPFQHGIRSGNGRDVCRISYKNPHGKKRRSCSGRRERR